MRRIRTSQWPPPAQTQGKGQGQGQIPFCDYFQSHTPIGDPTRLRCTTISSPQQLQLELLRQEYKLEQQRQQQRVELRGRPPPPRCSQKPPTKMAVEAQRQMRQYLCDCSCAPIEFMATPPDSYQTTHFDACEPLPGSDKDKEPLLARYMQQQMEAEASRTMNKLYGIDFYATRELPLPEHDADTLLQLAFKLRKLLQPPRRVLMKTEMKHLCDYMKLLLQLPVKDLTTHLELCFLSGALTPPELQQLRRQLLQLEMSSATSAALTSFYQRLSTELPRQQCDIKAQQDLELLRRVLLLQATQPSVMALRVLQAAFRHMISLRGRLVHYLRQLLRQRSLSAFNLQQLAGYLRKIDIELQPPELKQLKQTLLQVAAEPHDNFTLRACDLDALVNILNQPLGAKLPPLQRRFLAQLIKQLLELSNDGLAQFFHHLTQTWGVLDMQRLRRLEQLLPLYRDFGGSALGPADLRRLADILKKAAPPRRKFLTADELNELSALLRGSQTELTGEQMQLLRTFHRGAMQLSPDELHKYLKEFQHTHKLMPQELRRLQEYLSQTGVNIDPEPLAAVQQAIKFASEEHREAQPTTKEARQLRNILDKLEQPLDVNGVKVMQDFVRKMGRLDEHELADYVKQLLQEGKLESDHLAEMEQFLAEHATKYFNIKPTKMVAKWRRAQEILTEQQAKPKPQPYATKAQQKEEGGGAGGAKGASPSPKRSSKTGSAGRAAGMKAIAQLQEDLKQPLPVDVLSSMEPLLAGDKMTDEQMTAVRNFVRELAEQDTNKLILMLRFLKDRYEMQPTEWQKHLSYHLQRDNKISNQAALAMGQAWKELQLSDAGSELLLPAGKRHSQGQGYRYAKDKEATQMVKNANDTFDDIDVLELSHLINQHGGFGIQRAEQVDKLACYVHRLKNGDPQAVEKYMQTLINKNPKNSDMTVVMKELMKKPTSIKLNLKPDEQEKLKTVQATRLQTQPSVLFPAVEPDSPPGTPGRAKHGYVPKKKAGGHKRISLPQVQVESMARAPPPAVSGPYSVPKGKKESSRTFMQRTTREKSGQAVSEVRSVDRTAGNLATLSLGKRSTKAAKQSK